MARRLRVLQEFLGDNDEKSSQAAESVNSVYGADTIRVNYAQFWFHPLVL